MRGFNFKSIRWQILSIVIFATMAFSFFLGIALLQSSSQSKLLDDIQTVRYPVQAKLQEAVFTLRLIQLQMEQAVVTNEIDVLLATQNLKEEFHTTISSIADNSTDYQDVIRDIDLKFSAYFESSFQLANNLILGTADFDDAFFLGSERVAENYNSITEALEGYKQSELDNLTVAIENASQRAEVNTAVSALVGIAIVTLVISLAYYFGRRIIDRINHIVFILRNIARDEDDMTVRIRDDGKDEMGELAFWFNIFIAKLQKITHHNTQEIKRLAFTDALTRLPNRRLFTQHLDAEIKRCERENTALAVMFLDLDNFKMINDQMGHDAGDQLVRNVGQRLTKTLRGYDVVALDIDGDMSAHPMVARMGGDEFMLIIPGLESLDEVANIAERVRRAVLDPMEIDGKKIEIGVSIGVALYPEDGTNSEQIIVNADLAMYEAKSKGKNNYRFFEPKMQELLTRRMTIEKELQQLIIRDPSNELSFHFQPKFNLRTDQMVGAEALLRWHSQTLGILSPEEFIPIAESSPLIYQLDHWVINTVCRQMSEWRQQNIRMVPTAVNISAKFAGDKNLVDLVEKALHLHNIPPALLELEITETSALTRMSTVADNIKRLKALGVRVAIDDFGAGNASLSLFRICKVDTLKIDRAFVNDLAEDQSAATLKGIFALATQLDVDVVAEGIESNNQVEALKAIGCNLGQGFLLSKSMTASAFKNYLMDIQAKEASTDEDKLK